MGHLGNWKIFTNDDKKAPKFIQRASHRGEDPNVIERSQKIDARKKEKARLKNEHKEAILATMKFCCNCGNQFGIKDFPGISYSTWTRTVHCANCPKGTRNTTVKHCYKCNAQFNRLPKQSLTSWANVKLCNKCKVQF